MAKIKTAKELKDEAKKVLLDAKKKHQTIIKEANILEAKLYSDIGKAYIDFIEGKITHERLKTIVKLSELLENSTLDEYMGVATNSDTTSQPLNENF